jgi:hypothetical protein
MNEDLILKKLEKEIVGTNFLKDNLAIVDKYGSKKQRFISKTD